MSGLREGEKVLFFPRALGRNAGYRMGIPLEQMISGITTGICGTPGSDPQRGAFNPLEGLLLVHQRLRAASRARPPEIRIRVIVHPNAASKSAEAPIKSFAEGIIKAIRLSHGTEWAVGTNPSSPVGKELKEPQSHLARSSVCVCTTMFRITRSISSGRSKTSVRET